MSVGKYSPTVQFWYAKDQDWHTKNSDRNTQYDRDGYDSYGYNKQGRDRAGYTEEEYLLTAEWQGNVYVYTLYEDVVDYWCLKPMLVNT